MSALAEVCQRLHTHFESLSAERAEVGASVYALEHPLAIDELSNLQRLLANSCKSDGLSCEYKLAWIVLAAECGYEYSGVQYWPMLDKKVPAWQFRHREVLRGYFEAFAREMRGAVPAGVWANHFNVIAWPITNAILPRDLQVFLSHAVYLSRYYLGRSGSLTNSEVGRIVAQHAYSHGDRFVRFLNQFDFVGSLVKQLLHMETDLSVFEERTFRRIVADLEGHAEARYWLREARAQVKPKIRIAPNYAPAASAVAPSQGNPTLASGLIMRADAQGKWELYVQPPSLIRFLQDHPGLAAQVGQYRFSVLGNDAQLFPLRDLLGSSPRERQLLTFPKSSQPLLDCVPSTGPIAHQLREGSALAPRSVWVYRIRKDGVAGLQSTPVLSPGCSYLLVQQESQGKPLPGLPQESGLQLIRIAKLEVPRTLTDQDVERFGASGLIVRRRTTVRAWGTLPRRWHDEDSAEYVEGESIFLRVERDHVFDALRCEVGTEKLELDWPDSSDMLLKIEGLPRGEHDVRIDTCKVSKSGGCTTRATLSSANLRLSIRSPSVWAPDQIPHEALAIDLVPTEPTLTEILSGKAQLSVRGQAGAPVTIEVILSDDQGETRHQVVRRKPPIDTAEWGSRLSSALSKDEDLTFRALGADRGHLAVTCETFGSHRLPIGIFPEAVRWIANREESHQVRLRVRCDGIDMPALLHFSFDDPGTGKPVSFADAAAGIESANGLYIARSEEDVARIIVSSPPREIRGLAGLSAVTGPRFSRQMSAKELVQACRDWASAPVVGKLADLRRGSIVSMLHRQLVAVAAGQDWIRLEQKVSDGSDISALDPRVSPKNRNYGITLAMRSAQNSEKKLFEAFRSASLDYRISQNEDTIRLAWRLALDPSEIPPDTDIPDQNISDEFSDLTRGARLLKLRFDRKNIA